MAATCTGYLTAILGARTVFCTGALIFGLGALTCALAPSMGQVVAGRFVQGFGGGLLTAMAYVLVRSTFPENLWARGFALLSGAWSMSILVGPLVGGLFARYGDWRGAFFAVTAMAVVLVVVALRALPRTATSGASARVPGLRVLLICVAIAAMSLMAIAPGVPAKVLLLAGAIAALVLTMAVDRRAPQPLLPTDAFSLGSIDRRGPVALPAGRDRLQPAADLRADLPAILHGLDPLERGLHGGRRLVRLDGHVAHRRRHAGATQRPTAGRRPAHDGVGTAGRGPADAAEPAPIVFPAIALVGAGIGACWAFIAQRVMSGARAGEEDLAASSVATVQQTGFALGAALAGLVANAAGLSAGSTARTSPARRSGCR